MGIELKSEQVEKKLIRRCYKIEINAPYGKTPTIAQEYETVTLIDGEYVKSDDISQNGFVITDLFDVTIEVNGKTITGADVAQFFFAYNDMPKE